MKYKIEDLLNFARSRGGECLDDTYLGADTDYAWYCEHGHIFLATWINVKGNRSKKGTWCRYCAGKLSPDEWLIELADFVSSKGKLLSTNYVEQGIKLKWKCLVKSHPPFMATPANVYNHGSWCPLCSGTKVLESDLVKKAKENGGHYLGGYKKNTTACLWKCSDGHEFKLPWVKVQANRWCGDCTAYKMEEIVRRCFESIFKVQFLKVRKPSFLYRKKGDPAEIDGLASKKIQGRLIGFEHHGDQHFVHKRHFHQSADDFKALVKKDQLKRRRCKKEGILLIEIDSLGDKRDPVSEVYGRIKKVLYKESFDTSVLDFDSAPSLSEVFRESEVDKLQALAKSKGGKLISKTYLGSKVDLIWKCKNASHPAWPAPPSRIKSGAWCGKCGHEARAEKDRAYNCRKKLTKDLRKAGVAKLLDAPENITMNSTVLVECENGHIKPRRLCRVFQHRCADCLKLKKD